MDSDVRKFIKNPEIIKLCENLKRLPEYLEERRRKREARKEFCRSVFEQACKQAGLLDEKWLTPRKSEIKE